MATPHIEAVPESSEDASANGGLEQRLAPPSVEIHADRPLEDDSGDCLGFGAYADALAELIDHPETDTPLTIAISAPWGAGKSSLAKLVGRRLIARPRQRGELPHLICWFNAWLHD